MDANSCFKYMLCVEWTTELPFDDAPRESPRIFWGGLEWYFKFEIRNGWYCLGFNKVNENSYSNWNILITSSIKDASALDDEPVLIERTETYGYSTTLWRKTRKEISDQIPNIFAIGKCTLVCLLHTKETHFEKTQVSREIDFASTNRSPLSVDLQSLSRDFSTFLKDETFSDVKLICGDRTFSAHRSVLAARSEVFAAMFRNKMAETEVGEVDLQDTDPEVLELLLQYLYSGKKPDLLERSARRLYEAADKYAVHALKGTCAVWLVGNLSVLNCMDLLVLAEKQTVL